MKRIIAGLVSCIAVGLFPCIASAVSVLDQDTFTNYTETNHSTSIGGSSSNFYNSQTFTVGVAGQLSQLKLWVGYNWSTSYASADRPDLTIEIVRQATDGTPSWDAGDVLASHAYAYTHFNVAYLNGSLAVDLSADNIQVAVGDKLAFVMKVDGVTKDANDNWPGLNTYGWDYSALTSYYNPLPGGMRYSWHDQITYWNGFASQSHDIVFQTYVEPSSMQAVPLPAAFWAGLPLLGGLMGVKTMRRRGTK